MAILSTRSVQFKIDKCIKNLTKSISYISLILDNGV